MNTFYLVRHAHAFWKRDEQRPLSPQGEHDAEQIAGLLQHLPIKVIYSSPYRRARQTANPLASRLNIPAVPAPELRERKLGKIGDIPFQTAVARTWSEPYFSFANGEPNAAAQQRVLSFFWRLQKTHQGQHILLSTHGNLLALLLQHFENTLGFDFWQSLAMPDIYSLQVGYDKIAEYRRMWPGPPGIHE